MTTHDIMNVDTLLDKGTDADLLHEMIGFTEQRLMELEIQCLTGASHSERPPGCINHRNGYRSLIQFEFADWEVN